ncbi:MAG: tetratricopeptide repeat protein [Chloracidobacterium sp.]|nr:tetratricopeptide repeat protein [Chloracidobacterium sp.]
MTSRQFEKAEAAYKNLVQVQENSPESRLELAEFYATTERKDEAVAVLEQIIADSPDYVLARYRVGQMYLDRKETVKVYEQLDALLKINDDDTQALMLRSRAKMQDSKPDEAVKDIEDVLKQQPSNRDALYLMAQARLALGQNDQANAFIGDIERFHPTFMKVGLLKIQAAFSAGDAQNALKLSNELIDKTNSTQPNADNTPQIILDLKVKGISSRGLAYLDLGKLAEAKHDLQDVVRLTPRSSGAMVNLAKVFIAERNAAAALELYEKAYAADAKNFDAISGIVNMAIQMGQTEKAHADRKLYRC